MPIVKIVTGCPSSDSRNYIFLLNKTFWIPSMKYSLLNPIQLRAHEGNVEDNPYDHKLMIDWTLDNKFCTYLNSQGVTILLIHSHQL